MTFGPALPAALDPGRLRAPVLGLTLVCTGIELGLQVADLGLWGQAGWRDAVLRLGAVWAQQANPWLQMRALLTHGLLHTGILHLAGNMMALWVLAARLKSAMGPWAFLALWALATMAGGVVFSLLSDASAPMVGSSGALFGLAGALLFFQVDKTGQRLAWILALVGLNLAVWVMQNGVLAWQAHLGGFLAGVMWAGARPGRTGVSD